MQSMGEAMKAALEHPIEGVPHRPKLTWKPKSSAAARGEQGLFWVGLLGSLGAGLLLIQGKRMWNHRSARAQALARMDFGGD